MSTLNSLQTLHSLKTFQNLGLIYDWKQWKNELYVRVKLNEWVKCTSVRTNEAEVYILIPFATQSSKLYRLVSESKYKWGGYNKVFLLLNTVAMAVPATEFHYFRTKLLLTGFYDVHKQVSVSFTYLCFATMLLRIMKALLTTE